VRAGRERTTLLPDDPDHSIAGVQAHWQPSPRTTFDGFVESRFFGRSWRLAFDHRRPRVAFSALVSRLLDSTPEALLDLPPFENVSSLIDSAFATRFPDPVERARLVQDLIARQGLPAQTLAPLTLFAPRISVVTTRQASVALLGVRNTVTFTAYYTRTEDAVQADPLLVSDTFTNNTQQGASALLSHRLTPTIALNVSADWSRIEALQSEDRSIERTLRLRLNAQVAPKTAAYTGVRFRDIASNVASEGHEGAVFVGLDHRF
jgi:uncharacterized protein (PEP-CTERM system associated)